MSKTFYLYLYITLLLARLLSIFTFVQFPIITAVYVYFLDLFDYGAAIRANFDFAKYSVLDKSLDLITRFYMLYAGYVLGGPFMILLVMVLYRLIGDIGLALTHNRKFLFLFPNFIEFFFPLYVIYVRYFPGDLKILGIFLAISIALKMLNEYLLHVKNWIDPVSLAYLKKHPKLRKISKRKSK